MAILRDNHTDDSTAGDRVRSERSHAVSTCSDEDVDRIAPVVRNGDRDEQTDNRTVDTNDSSSAEEHLMSKSPKSEKGAEDSVLPLLRYRRTSLWLLVCYVPFLVLPWILTCIMTVRPPSLPSYINQKGEYGWNTVSLLLPFWLAFVRILNSIASVLVIPITSALLAQGAVVFTQRRKPGQQLDLRQMFALSDRGWADILILWGAYRGKGTASKYLKAAAALLALSAIQAPIQSVMTSYEVIVIMTSDDSPLLSLTPAVLGYDPEPQALAMTPQTMVISDVIKSLATVTDMDQQTYLWRDTAADWSVIGESGEGYSLGNTFFVPYTVDQSLRYFVSAFPNDTDTGVLREHVMRLNSSAECHAIDPTAFPKICDGPEPLVATYSSKSKPHYGNYSSYGDFSIDVCVPGNQSASPWTLSRDRQDIAEDLYIKVHVDYETFIAWGYIDVSVRPVNFTVHCTANTTRGYFELGNWRNDFTYGPLLEKWPDNETLLNNFNDYTTLELGEYGIPSTIDHFTVADPSQAGEWHYPIDPFNREERRTPGPLMTSGLAMFGPDSLFYLANNATNSTYTSIVDQICQGGNIPFTRLDGLSDLLYKDLFYACWNITGSHFESGHRNLDIMLYEWISTFSLHKTWIEDPHVYSKEALEVAMFFANLHWLTETATATKVLYSARNIWTSPGFAIPKPVVPLYGKITVSILIALQLLGLAWLTKYIYSVPTWTEKLDSCAIAQLTHDVDLEVLTVINKPDEESLRQLKRCHGIVGLEEEVEHSPDRTDSAESEVIEQRNSTGDVVEGHQPIAGENDTLQPKPAHKEVRLARGAPGIITQQHAAMGRSVLLRYRWRRSRKANADLVVEKERDSIV